MITQFNLEYMANLLAKSVNEKPILDKKFKLEYIIPNITEKNLNDKGFIFKEYSSYNICPLYVKDNLVAWYDEGILHLSKI